MTRRVPGRLAALLTAGALAATATAVPAAGQVEPAAGPGDVAAGVAPATSVLDGPPPSTWPRPPDVAAPIHLLVEADTGQVLATAGADERRAVASTVKILTALVVADLADPADVVTIDEAAASVGGSSVELEAGDRWTVEQLLLGLLVRSGNDAAEALAIHVAGDVPAFTELMAEEAMSLGLPVGPDGLVLTSPSGLGDDNRLSAEDLAVVARAALDDTLLAPMLRAEEVTLPGVGTVENRNLLVGSVPGSTGVKTGFTEAAGSSLVGSAERDGRELVVVVLGGGPDPERFVDATTLLDHGFDAYAPVTVSAERTVLLAGGDRTLTVTPREVTVPTDAAATVTLPLPLRVLDDAGVPTASLTVDGDPVADLPVAVAGTAPPDIDGASEVGRGLVDGVHAALRAAHADGAFPAASGGPADR